jgi:uncharacterized membrane protein YkvA (DUF1232 family)
MPTILSRARELLLEVPRHGKLAYCLLRDERVPRAPKVALLAVLGVIVSPINFPKWIPVLGELDILALTVLAVKTFIEACPEEVRREHEAALKAGDSLFDRDLRDTAVAARQGMRQVVNRVRSRVRRGDDYEPVPEG